jgi:hypothetical protein
VADNKSQKLKLNQLVLDLKSDSTSKITAAVTEIANIGDISIIPVLVLVLKNNQDLSIQKQVKELLADIQLSQATEMFMEELKKEEEPDDIKKLLGVFWNSKLDFSDYLADFVEVAIDGDYLIALDCLTVIENMAGPFSESQLLEAQLHLKEFAENKNQSDDRKNQIVSEIALFVKDQNEGIDADLLLD